MTDFRTRKDRRVYPVNKNGKTYRKDFSGEDEKTLNQLKQELRGMRAPKVFVNKKSGEHGLLLILYEDREEVYEFVKSDKYKEVEKHEDVEYDKYKAEEMARGSGYREVHYKSITDDWQGLSRGKTSKDFDREQLEEGTAVEMEHTNNKEIAERIAMDHLTEDPNYYIKLEKMEKK